MRLGKYISVLILPLFLSCSEVAEDDRFIELPPVSVNRCVLIEDFTGQRCVNCPAASTLIESLQKTYGADAIVAVGIHSGPMAKSTPLRTDDGDYLYEKYQVEAQPSGMINRRGGVFKGIDGWGAQVYNEIQTSSAMSMSVTNVYDSADGTVKITVTLMNTDPDVETGKLNVWLTEDGIVSPQYMEDGSSKKDYVHNHVFRAAVTEIDGTDVVLKNREEQTVELTAEVSDAWQVENLSVVAFVDSNNGVLQAVKAKVINN